MSRLGGPVIHSLGDHQGADDPGAVEDLTEFLRQVSLFKEAPPEDLARISDSLVAREIDAGTEFLKVGERGDTLYAVARQYGVVAYEVARLNDLKPPYIIQIGQSLVLPDAGRLRTAPVSRNAEAVTLPSSSRIPTTARSSQPPAPAPRPATLGTGQPMLMSIESS